MAEKPLLSNPATFMECVTAWPMARSCMGLLWLRPLVCCLRTGQQSGLYPRSVLICFQSFLTPQNSKRSIQIARIATKQFVKLVGEQISWTLDIRKKDMPAWNLILFKKTKTPLIVPTIGLTTEKVRDYFETRR